MMSKKQNTILFISLMFIMGAIMGLLGVMIISAIYELFPEVKVVNISDGFYKVPNGYVIQAIKGKACHVVGWVSGNIKGTVSTFLTNLVFVPHDNKTIVCDTLVISNTPKSDMWGRGGGVYYIMGPSELYLKYEKPIVEQWWIKGIIIGGTLGVVAGIIISVKFKEQELGDED